MRRRAGSPLAVALIVVGLACEPIVGDPGPAAPTNDCPAHPCAAYKPSGAAASCTGGVCTVATPTANLLLVIGLATDSYLAPGRRTYITTLNGGPSASGACRLPDCSGALCQLPQWTLDHGSYLVTPYAAGEVNWYLGAENVSSGTPTSLPVQATYRRLLGASQQDALDLGLPVDPVQAKVVTSPDGNLGPNGSAQIGFQTYLQAGCYERTLQPFAPLSTAFPPAIKPWTTGQAAPGQIPQFDVTREETTLGPGQGALVPTFDIARAEGLEGWTAYLRNAQTKRVFSNVVSLRGSLVHNVTLATYHVANQGMDDALTNLELVVEPPAGQPQPREVFAPTAKEIASSVTYEALPTPVTVTGRIETPAGDPVPAFVEFTATSITKPNGERFPPNFEFTASVSTTPDKHTGAATYSALLPRGEFRIAVRPTDGKNAVTVVTRTVGGEGNEMTGEDIDVGPLVTVSGTAAVADGRLSRRGDRGGPPLACAPVPGAAAMTDTSEDGGDGTGPVDAAAISEDCLPREASGLTGDDGGFNLAVDPGQYLLRVRPRDGSRLPWKVQPIVVDTTGFKAGKVEIPAPISVGMRLTDSVNGTMPMAVNNPVVNAIVRVFTDPTQTGSAVELGEAITDVNGNYEMYIAPPTQ